MPREDDKGAKNPGGVHIPVDHIRETIMPPYEYQKPENGFGILVVDNQPPSAPVASEEKETS